MKLAVVSRDPNRLKKHLSTVRKYRANLSRDPEVVVAIGGDGTFLAAERLFPTIPKLPVRDESICNKCDWDNVDEGIKRLLAGKYSIKSFEKLAGKVGRRRFEAVNDIVIRNVHPIHAIRFKLWVNGKQVGGEFIGDGIVVSTVFGSEGYFRSITRKHFEKGIGIAFNNTVKEQKPLMLDSRAKVVLELTRGLAHVAADNDHNFMFLHEGEKIVLQRSTHLAHIVRLR
jgi:hypothetical protein